MYGYAELYLPIFIEVLGLVKLMLSNRGRYSTLLCPSLANTDWKKTWLDDSRVGLSYALPVIHPY